MVSDVPGSGMRVRVGKVSALGDSGLAGQFGDLERSAPVGWGVCLFFFFFSPSPLDGVC